MKRKLYLLLMATIITLQIHAQTADELNSQVTMALKNYYAAVNKQDVDKAISYYLNSPSFITYVNGHASNYEEWTKQVRTFLPTPKQLEYSFDTLYTRKINDDAVFVTGPFHQHVVDADNKESFADITATMVLIRIKNEWKIAYAASVYLPANGTKQ
jgi:ketosteroid isomerase-like protein